MKDIRVLVVDDAAFVRDLIKKGLRDHFPKFRISEAPDGAAAQAHLENHACDLVLCDWEMPRMSGDQVLEWMRANPKTEKTPFIMITSRGERENVMRAVELKADNYIVKPFTTDRLVDVITRTLSRAMKISPAELRGQPERQAVGGAFSGDLPIAAAIVSRGEGQELRVRPSGKVVVALRFSDSAVACLLTEIGVRRLVGVIRRDAAVPKILDLAVLDLESDGRVSRINGFVHKLQAREPSQASEFINITVDFIDDDEDKLQHLRGYITGLGGAN